MTPYDLVVIGVIVGGMAWGAIRGITWQVASIASLVLGYAVAFPLSARLASHFPGDPLVARGLAMLVVYIAVSGSVYLIAWMIRATLRRMKFEAYDRHLGMVLGGLEGALLAVVGTLFMISLSPGSREAVFGSPSGRVVSQILAAVQPALPGEIQGVLEPLQAGRGRNEGNATVSVAELRRTPGTASSMGSRSAGVPGRELDPEVIRGRLSQELQRVQGRASDALRGEIEQAVRRYGTDSQRR